MKAIILNAGYGSRLLPLTLEIPKCLVEVDGRPILSHQLDALHAAGVEEAVIVVGYKHRKIEEALAGGTPLRVSTLFNPFWSVANSIGSVWAARAHLDAPFCLVNGDTVFDPAVLAGALRRPEQGVGLLVESTRDPALDDMRVAVGGGRVLDVSKDLDLARTTHRSLGVVIGNEREGNYRRALEAVIEREGGQASYHHAVVAHLAATGGVAAIERDAGDWREIDRPEDIEAWGQAHHPIAP